MTPPQQPTTTLLLARHGEVDAAWRGTVYGRLDVPLSELGLRQSALVAEALGSRSLDAVVSSGLRRAEAAAALVRAALIRAGQPALDREDHGGLLELDRGDWAGRKIAELAREEPAAMDAWRAARGAVAAPGGEDPSELALRVRRALDELAGRHPGGTVAVVAHLWVVRAAVTCALGLEMKRSGRIGLPPGGLCELEWPVEGVAAGRRPRLVRLGA